MVALSMCMEKSDSLLQFDANDALHVDFLVAAANLYATSLGHLGFCFGTGTQACR